MASYTPMRPDREEVSRCNECQFEIGPGMVCDLFGLPGLQTLEMVGTLDLGTRWFSGRCTTVCSPTHHLQTNPSLVGLHCLVALFSGWPNEGTMAVVIKGICVSHTVQFWLGDWNWQSDICGEAVGKKVSSDLMDGLRKRRRAALRRAKDGQSRQEPAKQRTSNQSWEG